MLRQVCECHIAKLDFSQFPDVLTSIHQLPPHLIILVIIILVNVRLFQEIWAQSLTNCSYFWKIWQINYHWNLLPYQMLLTMHHWSASSKLQNGREFSKFTCVRLCVHKHPKMEGNNASPPSSSTGYQSRWCRNSISRPLAQEHGNRWSSKVASLPSIFGCLCTQRCTQVDFKNSLPFCSLLSSSNPMMNFKLLTWQEARRVHLMCILSMFLDTVLQEPWFKLTSHLVAKWLPATTKSP